MKLIDDLGTATNPYGPSGGTALYDAVEATIANMAEKKEQDGWEFVFMGSGGAAWTEGQKLTAVGQDMALNYAGNTRSLHSYAGTSASLTMSRASGQSLNSTLSAWKRQRYGSGPEGPQTPYSSST